MKILITGGNGNIAKIIKNNLTNNIEEHTFNAPGRDKLNLLDAHMVKDFMEHNDFDICFHTCILQKL